MTMRMEVFAKTRFVAFHQWENAPECCKYLASPHRHEFHVEVAVAVELSDREVEFHRLKTVVDTFINTEWKDFMPRHVSQPAAIGDSCELLASRIGSYLRHTLGYNVNYVEVSEDGECGGRVIYG